MTEQHALIEAAIHRYLLLFEFENTSSTLRDIAMALDDLVRVYFDTPDVEPDTIDGPAAPQFDEAGFGQNAARFFERDDVIWLIDPEGGPDQKAMCTFATSELAEIAADLNKVLWLFENGSAADAIWEFRFGYQAHWGEHLHRVRHYLHGLSAW
ncbi:DUF5063 domain-containing protein [Porphyrobacter sp. YT40]|uniref:DUF5063 domain-containing protein n=1 Tax=Porphyrobacter sp. YT40 TaxID=2547601 RepID=UPI001142D418|nr:DUF5063 domain-containing protein [Porphyrobacter sp. YT40]QDH33781.1 DUF5063 domain-containing protein [Porphyrobacter sp. YT40]